MYFSIYKLINIKKNIFKIQNICDIELFFRKYSSKVIFKEISGSFKGLYSRLKFSGLFRVVVFLYDGRINYYRFYFK